MIKVSILSCIHNLLYMKESNAIYIIGYLQRSNTVQLWRTLMLILQ